MPPESLQEILEKVAVFFPGVCKECPVAIAIATSHSDLKGEEGCKTRSLSNSSIEVIADGLGRVAYAMCANGPVAKCYSQEVIDATGVVGGMNCGVGLKILTCLQGVLKDGAAGTNVSTQIPDEIPDNFT